MPRAGTLNRRVRLQQVTMTSDSEGVSGENWTDLDVVWAHISPIGGLERIQAAQTEEKITHQVTIRWRKDVTGHMRFLYTETAGASTRLFYIKNMLDPDEAHREIDCMCEEIVTTQVGAT